MRIPANTWTLDHWAMTCGKGSSDRAFRTKLRTYFHDDRTIEDFIAFLRDNGAELVIHKVMSDGKRDGSDSKEGQGGLVQTV